jgi:hypothetical protein
MDLRQLGHRTLTEVPALQPMADTFQGRLAQEIAVERAAREAERREYELLTPVSGDIPDTVRPPSKGLIGARYEYLRFRAWLRQLEDTRDALMADRDRLRGIVSSRDQAKSRLLDLVKAGARALLGGVTPEGADEHSAAAAELASAEFLAASAEQAIAEADIDGRLEIINKQIEHLHSRERNFRADCLREHALSMEGRYREVIEYLRDVLTDIYACRAVARGENLQAFVLPSTTGEHYKGKYVDDRKPVYWIEHDHGKEARYRKWAEALKADPTTTKEP